MDMPHFKNGIFNRNIIGIYSNIIAYFSMIVNGKTTVFAKNFSEKDVQI